MNLTQASAVSQLTLGNVAYSKWSPVISRQKIYCAVTANCVNRDDDDDDDRETVKGEEEKEEVEEGEEEGRKERRTRRRRKTKRMR